MEPFFVFQVLSLILILFLFFSIIRTLFQLVLFFYALPFLSFHSDILLWRLQCVSV
jgi:hypothetical protein